MAWMNNETKEIVSLPSGDIKWATWMRVARNFRLRVGLKDKSRRENFDGFLRDVSNHTSYHCSEPEARHSPRRERVGHLSAGGKALISRCS